MDFGWMLDHLDDLAYRTFQHIELAGIAVTLGFLISFTLALVSMRRRTLYGPIVAVSDVIYTIPSLAMFVALITITGITLTTVEVPLILYTLLIFVRNFVAGLDAVPADVIESANGMGFTPASRLWRVEVPLAIPLIVAGLRLASVSTIGLVTISAVMGDGFGGLGHFILEGIRRSFPTEIYFGAVPSVLLAIAADLLFVKVQRRLTPWSQVAERPA